MRKFLLWTFEQAIGLIKEIEEFAPQYGCHVALTGGVLYKHGPRKDLDLLFYRIRQSKTIDTIGLFAHLEGKGICRISGWGWCHKATYCLNGCGEAKKIDLFFPEEGNVSIEHQRANNQPELISAGV
jgi:hypothetical protein